MIGLVLLVVVGLLLMAFALFPALTVLALLVLGGNYAVRRRRHRSDAFVRAMLQ